MGKIRKALIAFATTALGTALGVIGAGGLPSDVAGWFALAGVMLTAGLTGAYAVYKVPNDPAVKPPATAADAAVRR